MRQESALTPSDIPRPPARLFTALIECICCAGRRKADIRRVEYMLLRREGTVTFDCPLCGRYSAHRLVRLVPEAV
ncbi:MAG: hypothetical protein ACRD4D_10745 [Candidatus Acidiferrales bacterium]